MSNIPADLRYASSHEWSRQEADGTITVGITEFAQDALGYAAEQGLMIARNEHAAMFAGFGHRYPTVEIHSLSPTCEPWEQTDAERDAMADLIHAAHAATGADVTGPDRKALRRRVERACGPARDRGRCSDAEPVPGQRGAE